MVGLLGVVEFGARIAIKLDSPREGARPDDGRDDGDKCQTEEAARTPSEMCAVEDQEADHQSPDDGSRTLQRCV